MNKVECLCCGALVYEESKFHLCTGSLSKNFFSCLLTEGDIIAFCKLYNTRKGKNRNALINFNDKLNLLINTKINLDNTREELITREKIFAEAIEEAKKAFQALKDISKEEEKKEE